MADRRPDLSAIEVDGLGKRYRLGEDLSYATLRDTLAGFARRERRPRAADEFWALRDVSFAVPEGQTVGIIGRNGAGKSTLLRILSRITRPTEGRARMRGRMGTLLEVGTGFHPELTGRENVFLNGAILGMSRREIRRRFDEIVAFAGVERFLDTPLKRYSSGMELRLAFAVAAHVGPPILIVDEVLAVGDAEFQRQCLGKMAELGRGGRTVVFVSHDLGAVENLCERVIWLEGGRIRRDGDPGDVIANYLASGLSTAHRIEFAGDRGSGKVGLSAVEIRGDDGRPVELLRRDKPFTVAVRFSTNEPLPDLDVAIYLSDRRGVRVLDEAWSDTGRPPSSRGCVGEHEVALRVRPMLSPGEYHLGVWFGSGLAEEDYLHRDVLTLAVAPAAGDRQDAIERVRLLMPEVRWSMDRVSRRP